MAWQLRWIDYVVSNVMRNTVGLGSAVPMLHAKRVELAEERAGTRDL